MDAFKRKDGIVLRSIRTEDEPLFLKWHNDPDLREDIGGAFPFTTRTFRDICEQRNTDTPRNIWFAVELDGRLIGITGLHDLRYVQRNAEIALLIGERGDRRQGYGTAILRAVVDYAFQDLGLHRVYAQIYSHNTASQRLFEHAGFTMEGILRDASWWNGSFRDILIYGKIQG